MTLIAVVATGRDCVEDPGLLLVGALVMAVAAILLLYAVEGAPGRSALVEFGTRAGVAVTEAEGTGVVLPKATGVSAASVVGVVLKVVGSLSISMATRDVSVDEVMATPVAESAETIVVGESAVDWVLRELVEESCDTVVDDSMCGALDLRCNQTDLLSRRRRLIEAIRLRCR